MKQKTFTELLPYALVSLTVSQQMHTKTAYINSTGKQLNKAMGIVISRTRPITAISS